MQFAGFQLQNNLFLAPMAGVTDRPFRQLCRQLGAGLAVSEMVTSNALLYASNKTRRRTDHAGETGPISVQIAGSDPAMMAAAARHNRDHGAQIIDINMGCPAKKVCNVAAGSALMRDEALVARILEAVVAAVPELPVTLKFRTGWDREHRNAPTIARIAEESGIRLIAIHGRTRADLYMGEAEYDTIAAVKSRAGIPVIANGDIDSPQKAKLVLDHTGADGVMIGRAAQGRPWIFREIAHYLATGETLAAPALAEIHAICRSHLAELHAFYGELGGVRVGRKHIGWYTKGIAGAQVFRQHLNQLETPQEQFDAIDEFFIQQAPSLQDDNNQPEALAA
ncbi:MULTISPECIES: tRNA dihydrouridine synthase DusB [unclassified Uliginosibacterium]|uniref:tRNA dihydrouridine synthase DusB n=1 Tax=unclassified Uliginosibacterium TaxID=2621521 RepID=UPI000C7D0166|nr:MULTISPECIES: tRNA dihydrouridine synthase DusB [unclassified Uliginosibacterium]MDO6388212.1 tRNA dihydrouridine synthase DusB [Uliginosibacterium sp. 31-12]PLK50631.1 tRNA dihydrouridine synthase DusB [Uliginosibacterium sp. TH139]